MDVEPSEIIYFATRERFRVWLEAHHASSDELWVGYWKKSTGRPSVTWVETVDEALCFGWIDGIRKRVDEHAYTIRFTPRRARSVWSRRNVERFGQLSAAGRVLPAGHAAYAKSTSGRSRDCSFEQATSPELSAEFVVRLRENGAAWLDWQSRPPGYRRQVAHWVMSAKQESTRERRLNVLIDDSVAGRKVKPLR